ncbi:MAG: PAS domain S-box protein [Elusimicrobiota bacterium]
MGKPLDSLIVEDTEDDARLVLRELRRAGYEPSFTRVNTAEAMKTALDERQWDIILSDYKMPRFDAPAALAVARKWNPDVPFIVVSGTIGEDVAVGMIRAGANDYIMKNNLARLGPTVGRELRDAAERRAHRQAEQELRASENKYRTLAENLPQKVFVKDKDSAYVSCNGNYAEALNIAPDEIAGRTDYDFFPRERADKYRADDTRIMDSGRPEELDEKYIEAGREMFVHTIKTPVRDKLGNVTGLLGVFWDITERKKTEEALRKSTHDLGERVKETKCLYDISVLRENLDLPFEEKLRRIADIIPSGWRHPEITCARVVLQGREYRSENFKETPWKQSSDIAVQGKPAGSVEVRYLETRLELDEGPFLKEERLLIDDIARHVGRMAESMLAQKEVRMLSAMVEQSSEGMAIADLEGNLLFANESWAKMHGCPKAADLIGRHVRAFHTPEQLERDVVPSIRKTEELGFHAGEVGHVRKDGTTFHALATSTLLRDESGTLYALATIARDITERKDASEALRESEARITTLFDGATDGMAVADIETHRFVACNKAICDRLGYAREEFMRLGVQDIHPEDALPRVAAYIAKQVSGESSLAPDLPVVSKDGTVFFADVNATPITLAGRRCLLGVFRDVTERRKAEEALKRTEEQLRHAQKLEAVGKLAGGVAHDFNNLLTPILGCCSFLLKDLPPGSPARDDVEEIRSCGERAAALTRQLLAFSRKQVFRPKILSLNSVIECVEKMLRRVLGEDIELSTVLRHETCRVQADAGQLEQVIMNLAVNSRDAMPEGGMLTIETSTAELDEAFAAEHSGVKPGPYVMLAVTDSGCGMDKRTVDRIFEPFFTTKEMGKGTGLGLSTVYGIIKQSGGYIHVYSEPGQGTTFKVYLPRVEGELTPDETQKVPLEKLKGGETVLLVEDDDKVRKAARRALEEHGYTVLEAGRGEEAVRISEQYRGPIHLLLTDVVMPRMSGKQLAQRLAASRPDMGVLYISGYTEDAIVHHGMLEPGIILLEKPFTPESLARMTWEALHRREPKAG